MKSVRQESLNTDGLSNWRCCIALFNLDEIEDEDRDQEYDGHGVIDRYKIGRKSSYIRTGGAAGKSYQ
ncbi:hypothetical protein EVAR_89817_1 [Eumeta japonica]|uniref:Uncharacterized protein n=1 Tax=Eumeta variegata TaxID=151549 RepID=A0A4C1YLA5_EUMVA|nr:hypothetical protein EVAR_89817_1 [Eumeta japonica]